jgi:hypothetical protein
MGGASCSRWLALTRCLRLNAPALAFSLMRAIVDDGLIRAARGTSVWALAGYVAVPSAVYGWWGWSLAAGAGGWLAGTGGGR